MQPATLTPDRPLINPDPPAGDEERVAAVFDALAERLGFVPDGVRLYGISPPLLEAFVANAGYFFAGTRLSPVLTSMIRYLVSYQADCRFCIDMNEGFLIQMGLEQDAVRAARTDPELAPVDDKERPLLRLALKAVNEPHNVGVADLDAARSQGWNDRDIFDAVVQATSNRAFNFVLRTFKVEQQGVFA